MRQRILKICLMSKYPPIEGGESSKAYWLAKGLGKRGHEVHIVTNAWEVEEKYRENILGSDLENNYQPLNVHVHNTNGFVDPKYIPYSKPYTEKIASLAIDVIQNYDLQLIDSWYVLPYVISGYIVKTLTGKPQIMRHAGSDMTRLFESPYLRSLFISIFKTVDGLITCPAMEKVFVSIGVPREKIFLNVGVSVDPESFNPNVKPANLSELLGEDTSPDIPVVAYIGKLDEVKGVYELVDAASRIDEDFRLLFVTQTCGLEDFKDYIHQKGMSKKIIFLGFVPPWKIPSIIKRSTCVVIPERNFPVAQHSSILAREVLSTGGCLVLGKELYDKMKWLGIQDKESLVVVDPKNITEFKSTLEKILKDSVLRSILKQNARRLSEKIENFELYIDNIVQLYEQTLDDDKLTRL